MTSGTIPSIVTQSADYARLFMSARPFMVFCVGILIFGTGFCVGIYNRDDGVTFPVFNTETFIRVVRTLGCNFSVEELGFDPTDRVLTGLETQRLMSGNVTSFIFAHPGDISPEQAVSIMHMYCLTEHLKSRSKQQCKTSQFLFFPHL